MENRHTSASWACGGAQKRLKEQEGTVTLIYLAAGNSRRFGSNKLLYEVAGRPMYQHLLAYLVEIAQRYADAEVLVVTQYEEIRQGAEEMGASVVVSPDSHLGASYTIRAALEAAPHAAAYAFFVADQPYLSAATAEMFLLDMAKSAARLGCVSSRGETGNPVWFGAEYRTELMALQGDRGGKKVLMQHLDEARLFEVADEQELRDLDEKESVTNGATTNTGITAALKAGQAFV